MHPRFAAPDLVTFATSLLTQSDLEVPKALVVAETLVEGDLLGHSTHGLQLLSPYLTSLEAGSMTRSGNPLVLRDRGAQILWDGQFLPGPWLVHQAIDLALSRIPQHGIVTVLIRQSHHIACLQAYLPRVTELGLLPLLLSSDPSVASVSPHGGLSPLYTPNPLAAGLPTRSKPIHMDISMSTTTNGLTLRRHAEGQSLPGEWVKDARGIPTSDPSVLFQQPPGTILPLGGMELGHKGFALGILVEALTSALSGQGRAHPPKRWGANVFLQIIDPEAFGGKTAFTEETQWFTEACHKNPTPEGAPKVRLPGERSLSQRDDQLINGVQLYPGIIDSLKPWAEKYSIDLPNALTH